MYRDQLTHDERHLSTRLEAFGDIVFGFALSFSALQLTIPNHVSDLADPIHFFLYGATFAILITYWLRFHRVLTTGFRPDRFDRSMLFGFLASVSLMPWSMQSFVHLLRGTDADARSGFALYLIVLFGVTVFNVILEFRGLAHAYGVLDDAKRARSWQAAVRGSVASIAVVVALAIDVIAGIHWAWVPIVIMVPAMRLGIIASRGLAARLFGPGTSSASGVS